MSILSEYFVIETFEKLKLSKRELSAVKNLIALARERLWLAESHPKSPGLHAEFDELITKADIDTCKNSISIAKAVLTRYSNNK
jgi:hypothetical protein